MQRQSSENYSKCKRVESSDPITKNENKLKIALPIKFSASILFPSLPTTRNHSEISDSNRFSATTVMVYHSSFVDEEGVTKACGCPLLPLKTHIKGPAAIFDQDKVDIVDEAISFFRANVFFRNFNIKSSADKLLIYLTFYINVALKRLEGCRTLAVGTKAIINLGLENVPVPGETGFPFPGLFSLAQSEGEAELFRNYLKQIREETSGRLLSCAYRSNGMPNKWWLAFAKRKFMNIIVPEAATSNVRKPGYTR